MIIEVNHLERVNGRWHAYKQLLIFALKLSSFFFTRLQTKYCPRLSRAYGPFMLLPISCYRLCLPRRDTKANLISKEEFPEDRTGIVYIVRLHFLCRMMSMLVAPHTLLSDTGRAVEGGRLGNKLNHSRRLTVQLHFYCLMLFDIFCVPNRWAAASTTTGLAHPVASHVCDGEARNDVKAVHTTARAATNLTENRSYLAVK